MMQIPPLKRAKFDLVVLSFQGGGALGSYQVGVAKELLEAGYEPDWMVGTSIGAINAAIIAGNRPQHRLEKLLGFWKKITWEQWIDWLDPFLESELNYRRWKHFMGAQNAIWLGQPGFFHPRIPGPLFAVEERVDKISFYDTNELKETLLEFVDFNYLNKQRVRLSLGAVDVCSGAQVFFDNSREKLGPEHVMASGALPPGFPAVKIGNRYFWDGGLLTNTPISVVLNEEPHKNVLAFMVHLFNSEGLEPTNLDELSKRKKDIVYSSQYNELVHLHREIYSLRRAIFEIGKYLPEDKKQIHEVKKKLRKGWSGTLSLVRFLYPGRKIDLESMDYNFSWKTALRHFEIGCNDAKAAVAISPWKEPIPKDMGIAIHKIKSSAIEEEPI